MSQVAEILATLEGWGNEKMRAVNLRHGANPKQFGVNLTQLRGLAKELKTNHELGMELWETGQPEAMMLGTLIMKPKLIGEAELDKMAQETDCWKVMDWLVVNIIKKSPHKVVLAEKWRDSDEEYLRRAGWSVQHEAISKGEKLDFVAIMDRIEREMKQAPMRAQETMNYCLGTIGIDYPEHRARAIEIGENLGVFKDYPVPKGCTSPYVPLWIAAMAK